MALPINKSKLPSNIKGEALIDLITKTGGKYGKRPKGSEVKKFFKGTEVSQRPYAHLSQKEAAKRLEEAYKHFGIKESGKQTLRKEVSRIQAEQQTPPPIKKSSGPGLLSRLFGRPKTTSSNQAHKLSADRMLESLTSQPPVQPPTASQKPNLQTFKPTPKMNKDSA